MLPASYLVACLESWIASIASQLLRLTRHSRGEEDMAPSIASRSLERKVTIGICAMDKKAQSKPMQDIRKRLLSYGDFDIASFGNETLLDKDITEWPVFDAVLCWYSDGFPLEKAQRYMELRRPFLVNDLAYEQVLMDRLLMYRTLTAAGIPSPRHIVIDRSNLAPGEVDPEGFVESEEYVELGEVRIFKPFVEKPQDGNDHNIWIYYPPHMGGGVKRLFRKVGNKSSDYDPTHPGTVRRQGSYIIEEFMPTGGSDVKVYTVGIDYAHAEARKSPVVDGKVVRTSDGKELRFPILLTPEEKEMAARVVESFHMSVCGFDLLRVEGRPSASLVCDVNGWSFVKNSAKYYDDAADILRRLVLKAVAPSRLMFAKTPRVYTPSMSDLKERSVSYVMEAVQDNVLLDPVELAHTAERSERHELRCVLAVVRHGDRTPKQKVKVKVSAAPLLDLFERHKDAKGKQAKLKSPRQLEDAVYAIKAAIAILELGSHAAHVANRALNRQSSSALNRVGSLRMMSIDKLELTSSQEEIAEQLRTLCLLLELGGRFVGVNRKVQVKPSKFGQAEEGMPPPVEEVLLIYKYGGVLTHAGRQQAEDLGRQFRLAMYPPNTDGGLLRLHATYRHDFKMYSSDEGRVQVSAASFTKGLLDLEGASLTPILASLVNKAGAIEAFGKGASHEIAAAKEAIMQAITEGTQGEGAKPQLPPTGHSSAGHAPGEKSDAEEGGPPMHIPPHPLTLLKEVRHLVDELVDALTVLAEDEPMIEPSKVVLYSALAQEPSECKVAPHWPCNTAGVLLMYQRWAKLQDGFFKKGKFDISKIPDIYDNAKYDSIHNSHLNLSCLPKLYGKAKLLADGVVPNEYGCTPKARLTIGSKICADLMAKLLADLHKMRRESLATEGMADEAIDTLSADAFMSEGLERPSSFFSCNLSSRELTTPLSDRPGGESPKSGVSGSSVSGGSPPPGAESLKPTLSYMLPPAEEKTMKIQVDYSPMKVSSPSRHVRTRVYFTSESHMHSLLNVLRFGHMMPGGSSQPLISPQAQEYLDKITELDYLTQIVFRMYEDKSKPLDDYDRFSVEILFSNGANFDPYVVKMPKLHTLPTQPRVALHDGEGVNLQELDAALAPLIQHVWAEKMEEQAAEALAASP